MSTHYLASAWCTQERDVALRREAELRTPSVCVLKVGEVPRARAGLLGNYQWLDATGRLPRPQLSEISARLPLDGPAVEAAADIRAEVEIPDFRNRHDEVAALRAAHQTPGGRKLWVVVAPPLMGKSWLLARLEQALTTAEERWTVRHLDLRHAPLELRSNPTRLVGALLDVDTPSAQEPLLDDAALRDIAAQVRTRSARQMFVLDSAELLGPACAASTRTALTSVRRFVRTSSAGNRMSMVIGTRRHDEWRGLGSSARTGERFEAMRLTEFGHDVVHRALLDLPREFDEEERWGHAETLHRLSEGLPALLVKSVQWADDTHFRQMHLADSPDVLDAVARGYIENDLLSADSLLPLGGPRQGEALAVLREMLRVLSPYRLFTQSHLKFHLDRAPGLQQALTAARSSVGADRDPR